MLLTQPDARTKRALQSLRGTPDFDEVVAWLEHSLSELDRAKRATVPEHLLRQQQGASQAIAELVDHARGKEKAVAIARQHPGSG